MRPGRPAPRIGAGTTGAIVEPTLPCSPNGWTICRACPSFDTVLVPTVSGPNGDKSVKVPRIPGRFMMVLGGAVSRKFARVGLSVGVVSKAAVSVRLLEGSQPTRLPVLPWNVLGPKSYTVTKLGKVVLSTCWIASKVT